MYILLFFAIAFVCAVFVKGIHIVPEAQRGAIEMFGRYRRFAGPGFHWVFPLFGRLTVVTVAQQLIDTGLQLIISSDSLSAVADAQIFVRVMPDELSVKAALYNTDDYRTQTARLASAALKTIIGQTPLKRLSAEREHINTALLRVLQNETADWGIEILKAEVGELEFPREVKEALNRAVRAGLEKKAAADLAAAAGSLKDCGAEPSRQIQA